MHKADIAKKPTKVMGSFWTALPFMAPFLLLILFFYFIPVILTFAMSFTDMDFSLEWNFIGFENYRKILRDQNVRDVLLNTIKYVFFTLLINVALVFCWPLLLAILFKGKIQVCYLKPFGCFPA